MEFSVATGGFCGDLKNSTKQPHLVRASIRWQDLGFVHAPHEDHSRLRVTYQGRFAAVMTLTKNGDHQIHGRLPIPVPVWPVEYDIPHVMPRDGKLELRWDLVDRRDCRVSDVWLMRR
jgi:hypothetical protein